MLAKVLTCALIGLDGAVADVEVDVARGLPSLTIVGLPNATVKESSERARSAITNSELSYPLSWLTVNLAPADLRKGGSAYDHPIAVGILAASEQVFPPDERAPIIGELSLDGSVRHVNGVLPIASLARGEGITDLYVPSEDAPEAALVEGLTVHAVDSLRSLVGHVQGLEAIPPFDLPMGLDDDIDLSYEVDLQDIKGQEHAKRVLEVAVAGGHHESLRQSLLLESS